MVEKILEQRSCRYRMGRKLENFCMSQSSFFDLVTILQPHLQKQKTKMQNQIAVESQVDIFLYYISNKGHYPKIPNAVGIFRSSISILI